MNALIKKNLKLLQGNNPEQAKKAIKALCHYSKDNNLKEKLREIIDRSYEYDNYFPLFAIVILDEMRDLESLPVFLDVLETDEDFMVEASSDALVHLERVYPNTVIPALFSFVSERVRHDSNFSRISAYGVLDAFCENPEVKRFFMFIFEQDDECRDYIANILSRTGDKKLLSIFSRAIATARHFDVKSHIKEIKWACFDLEKGKSDRNYIESHDKVWQERWSFIFEDMVITEEQRAKEEGEAIQNLKKIGKTIKLSRDEEKRIAEFKKYTAPAFSFSAYIKTRERSALESEFQDDLSLLGLDGKYDVEVIQELINQNKKISDVLGIVLDDFVFPSQNAIQVFNRNFSLLWNNTPRDEFNGLTPEEKMS